MDTPQTLATDLIEDSGWLAAIVFMLAVIAETEHWRGRWMGLRILWAVVVA